MRSDEVAEFLLAAQAVAKEATDFGQVWRGGEASLNRHIGTRKDAGQVSDIDEYIAKTCDCLADADIFVIARGGYEKMLAMESVGWFLVYTESGRLVTSFPKVDGWETPRVRDKRLNWSVSNAKNGSSQILVEIQ